MKRRRCRRRLHDDLCELAVAVPPAELRADIHRRLPFLHRLAFASLTAASGHAPAPEAPWLVLPGKTERNIALLSAADGGKAGVAPAPEPAMRGHVVLGSGGGWLVTADARGALRMANPATGAQADLPDIVTLPLFLRSGARFTLNVEAFVQLRFGAHYGKTPSCRVSSSLPRAFPQALGKFGPLPSAERRTLGNSATLGNIPFLPSAKGKTLGKCTNGTRQTTPRGPPTAEMGRR
ncbi:hypothetical protein ACP70R_009251 [Stipagrostis hirtigluma subsp. patula]